MLLRIDIYTTIDANTQLMAEKAVIDNLEQYDTRHGYRGPNLHLWDFETQEAWAPRDILDYLAQAKEFNDLKAAVVTDVQEQSITALVKDGRFIVHKADELIYFNEEKNGLFSHNTKAR